MAMQSFDDLLRALREHPEWRQALRRELFTEELLALPQIVRDLAEAQQRTEARLEALTARVEALTARVEALVEAQLRAEQRLAGVEERLDRVEDRLGTVDGRLFELRYVAKAVSYFDKLLRKSRVLDWSAVADLLDQAAAQISPEERDQVMATDLVVQGRRLDDQSETYLLAELSVGIGEGDVERAAQRARILARATGRPVIPAVGGQEIIPAAWELAAELGVSVFLDGGLQAQ